MILSQMMSLSQISSLVGLPLVRWCTWGFLCRYVYPAKKSYVASHFCIGHVLDMGLIYLSIFLTHVDALLWFYICDFFYDDVE